MDFSYYIALLLFNSLLFSVSFFIIFKRQTYSVIAIRSPILTITNCICSFIMTNLLLCYEFLEEEDELLSHQIFCHYLPIPFIIAHLFFVITFVCRIHRFLQICMTSSNERSKAQEFYSKRMTLSEKYYLKYFFFCMIVIGTVITLVMLQTNSIEMPFYFQKCMNNLSSAYSIDGLSVWIFFFENLVLITYVYWVYHHQLKRGPKTELLFQLVLLIFQPNIARSIYNSSSNDYPFHKNVIVFIVIHYIYLSAMIYMPLAMSRIDKVQTSYHFTPKLNSNLYLFLSDEICYYSFTDFIKHTETDNFYIAIYTQIMKYKYKYTLEPNYYTVLEDAKRLYRNYFEKDNNHISKELMNKVKGTCLELINKEDCTYEMFDDALVFTYDVLEKIFIEYKKSEEYFLLVDTLNLHSYAMLKVFNSFSQQAYSL